MRLLNADTLEILEFMDEKKIPPYAILSHTWGEQECTFQGMKDPDVSERLAFKKFQYSCEQARTDGFKWVWIDT